MNYFYDKKKLIFNKLFKKFYLFINLIIQNIFFNSKYTIKIYFNFIV